MLGARRSSGWLEVVVDPVRLQILRVLTQVAEATVSDLAGHSQTSYQTLRRHLDALETFGVIHAKPGESDGETPGRPATRFSLPPEIRESVCSVFGAPR
jgi:predicted ArsR family transcriptional regulator